MITKACDALRKRMKRKGLSATELTSQRERERIEKRSVRARERSAEQIFLASISIWPSELEIAEKKTVKNSRNTKTIKHPKMSLSHNTKHEIIHWREGVPTQMFFRRFNANPRCKTEDLPTFLCSIFASAEAALAEIGEPLNHLKIRLLIEIADIDHEKHRYELRTFCMPVVFSVNEILLAFKNDILKRLANLIEKVPSLIAHRIVRGTFSIGRYIPKYHTRKYSTCNHSHQSMQK
jgi:hypothetical protein